MADPWDQSGFWEALIAAVGGILGYFGRRAQERSARRKGKRAASCASTSTPGESPLTMTMPNSKAVSTITFCDPSSCRWSVPIRARPFTLY